MTLMNQSPMKMITEGCIVMKKETENNVKFEAVQRDKFDESLNSGTEM